MPLSMALREEEIRDTDGCRQAAGTYGWQPVLPGSSAAMPYGLLQPTGARYALIITRRT